MANDEIKKPSALEKLQKKIATNGQTQLRAITEVKERNSLVSAVNEASLDIELITPNPFQPRKVFDNDKIIELAEAIKENGMIQPIAVRAVDDGYQIIAGERRYRACKYLGFTTIQAVIFNADDEATAMMALSENIDREDLTDYEIGQAILNISHLFKKKTELSRYTGKTRSDIYRYLAFNDLPDWLKNRLNGNPGLINRNNAQLLVSFFKEAAYSDSKHKEYVLSALNMIEESALTQTLLIPKIRRLIRDAENPRRQSDNVISKKYALNGKNIGGFSFDNHKVTIKITSELITEEVAKSIYQYVADALKEVDIDSEK
jgi:ParB family chromosome partitioning protein